MSSSEHAPPQAPAEPFDPARMNAQTARLMASDMAALTGAMFRLLQPQAAAQPGTAPVTAPVTPAPAPPAPAVPAPGLAVPGLDLQPPAPEALPATPAPPGIAVPAIAVPGLAVPGIVPPKDDSTLADFELDPEHEAQLEDEDAEISERADEPPRSDTGDPDPISPRSQALLNEIAFLDD